MSSSYYLPNVSGITIYMQILAEELVAKGHQVTILTSHHDLSSKKEEIINGVRIKRLQVAFKIGKGVIMPSFLWESIKEIRKSQIINCHLPQPGALWLSLWGRLLAKKVFLTHHTDLSFWKGIKNKIIDGGVFVCHFLAALLSNKLVPYTEDYANDSYFLKLFPKKIKAIYPPIKMVSKKDISLEKKIDGLIKNKKYIIGFCGRIAKQKGIEILIRASRILDKRIGKGSYLILMAGPIKVIGENYYDFLEKKYGKELKDKFVFLGNIERESLSSFYKKIDLLVLPSDDKLESFGWVQIEAMKNGAPCVTSNLSGVRIPVRESKMGEIFKIADEKDLAKKLELVLKRGKKDYQKEMDKDNRIFNYQKSIDDYEKLFKNS